MFAKPPLAMLGQSRDHTRARKCKAKRACEMTNAILATVRLPPVQLTAHNWARSAEEVSIFLTIQNNYFYPNFQASVAAVTNATADIAPLELTIALKIALLPEK